ncbi:MAG: F0F1 ATP synthase subunit B [Gemmatimonadaceae bacterium]|nr:F0F1 ATP synthase subunit B [Gemmatimonadaceae bacterium]
MHNLILLLQSVPEEATPKANLLSPNGGLMFWTLIVFLILFFVLGKFVFPKITAAVEAREKALEDAIEGAKRDREEAAKYLDEQRAAIETARNDAQKILAEGRSTGEKLRTEMMEETRVQQQDMLDRARREIEAERNRAIAEMRREAVDLAIAGASRVIEKNLDQKSNRDIVEKFLSSIPTAGAVGEAKKSEADSSPYADA